MDLDHSQAIVQFVERFYQAVLADSLLKPIFIDGAGIDIDQHKFIIVSFWEKLLLGDKAYDRNTMNIHRVVHEKYPFTAEAFSRWLLLFKRTVDQFFQGPYAERAKAIASKIAFNMEKALLAS